MTVLVGLANEVHSYMRMHPELAPRSDKESVHSVQNMHELFGFGKVRFILVGQYWLLPEWRQMLAEIRRNKDSRGSTVESYD